MSKPNSSTLLRDVNPSMGGSAHIAGGVPDTPRPPQVAEGLVSCQQSLGGVKSAPSAVAATRQRGRVVLSAEQLERLAARRAERRARVLLLSRVKAPRPLAPRTAHYQVVVESEDETLAIDNRAARIRRCQKRVHAWATALPKDNRRIRRAAKAQALGPRSVMVTLTYADAKAWQPNDIREFMIGIKEALGANLYGYAWVLEMQRRGAPHYHVLLYVKRGTYIEKPDMGLWKYGSTKIETARSLFYICTYTGKQYQKSGLPPGARMFAVQINADVIPAEDYLGFRLSGAPKWLAERLLDAAEDCGPTLRWARCKGGGWVCKSNGEHYISPWRVRAVVAV